MMPAKQRASSRPRQARILMIRSLVKGQDKVIAVPGLADMLTVDARRADDHHHLVAAGRDLLDL